MKKYVIPLQLIVVEKSFSQWGLDVVGPINPKYSKGHVYILKTTDYFTKRPEAVALKKANAEELIKFLKDNILSRYGVPDKFITDNGSILIGSNFMEFCGQYGIIMGQSSNYYPQGNGLAKSTNKKIMQILKKTIDRSHRNWHLKLTKALWASRITPKDSTWMYPYLLVYGKEVKMLISLELNALIFVVNTEDTEDNSTI
jgi:transposase InsO family protein